MNKEVNKTPILSPSSQGKTCYIYSVSRKFLNQIPLEQCFLLAGREYQAMNRIRCLDKSTQNH